jgi:GT2 family glycosyltransferase
MIRICIPTYHAISPETVKSLWSLDRSKFDLSISRGVYVDWRRNFTVLQSDTECSHYLFVDADIIFTERHIDKLVGLNADVVSGAYRMREKHHHFAAGYTREPVEYIADTTTGVLDVDFVGGGFLLVKKDVLDRLPYPWFHRAWAEGDGRRFQRGEDVSFCMLAREHGYRIILDCDCVVNHEIQAII